MRHDNLKVGKNKWWKIIPWSLEIRKLLEKDDQRRMQWKGEEGKEWDIKWQETKGQTWLERDRQRINKNYWKMPWKKDAHKNEEKRKTAEARNYVEIKLYVHLIHNAYFAVNPLTLTPK